MKDNVISEDGAAFACQACGKEDEPVLLTSLKLQDRFGEHKWVCTECFKKIHDIGFEDYRITNSIDT